MNRVRPMRVAAALLAVALVASGCGTFSRKPPAKERFVLAPGAPAAVAAKPSAGILRVDVVRGSPLASNRSFTSTAPGPTRCRPTSTASSRRRPARSCATR